MKKALFRLRYRAEVKEMETCPCGTEGGCEACAGPCQYLWDAWKAWPRKP